jgi:flagellar motor switch protein FliM
MSDQPLVTQQELDILAASMEIAQRQAREGRAAEVALYDFREAAKLSPDQTHELTDRCTVLSKVLSRTMSAYLNTTLQVAFEGLDHPSFDQYLRGLPPNPLLVVFQLDPTTAPAVWQIDLPVGLSMLTSMLGGGEQAPPPHSPDLTAIEQALLGRLFNEILQTWALTWPAMSNLQPVINRITSTVANLDISAYGQDIVHATFRFSNGKVSGPGHLALPHVSLQRLLKSTDTQRSTTELPTSDTWGSIVSQRAKQSAVRLVAEVAKMRLPLRKLSTIQPGDVIQLPPEIGHTITVTVAGAPKFLAQAGELRGHLAARIIEAIHSDT